MLPQKNRLKKKKDFERVFKQGTRIKQDLVYLKHIKNKLEDSRFGFVVGKNFSKKAIERNRAKRILREAVKEIDIKGRDIVIVVMPGAESLEETITSIMKKIK